MNCAATTTAHLVQGESAPSKQGYRKFDVSSAELNSLRIVPASTVRRASIEERRGLAQLKLEEERRRKVIWRIPVVSLVLGLDLAIWGYVAFSVVPAMLAW